ncbi:hypothetical protein [Acinetobacter proteolyticus]|nr:hypothetical protein [Acinetobacter proteolyticus]
MFVVGHYIAATQDDNPNFEIGEARYSDYLMGDTQFKHNHIDLGEYEGDV